MKPKKKKKKKKIHTRQEQEQECLRGKENALVKDSHI